MIKIKYAKQGWDEGMEYTILTKVYSVLLGKQYSEMNKKCLPFLLTYFVIKDLLT